MIARVISAAPIGYDGALIEVESDAKAGLPDIRIVGMGNKSIDEARERVRSAISNSLLDFPARKLVINLAPAELPKDGTHLDLAIALSILVVSGQLKQTEAKGAVFVGELALDGSLRAVRGAISLAETARQAGFERIYMPAASASQARLVEGVEIIGVQHLKELFLHLKGERLLRPPEALQASAASPDESSLTSPLLDDVQGQHLAKRALVIACAGHHNLLLSGPPGSGKTMLARVAAQLLPPPSDQEQLAITKLHSLAGEADDTVVTTRPFRSPHHTVSMLALLGGGSRPHPGEISLAHLGVLFLDELPEFPRATLEALRQPLEDRRITIARALGRVVYPADFMLIGTMNPCPCGYYEDPAHECRCSTSQIQAYQHRLSGPLLDRIDLRVTVAPVAHESLFASSRSLQKNQHLTEMTRIEKAISLQRKRYKRSDIYNGNLSPAELKRLVLLTPTAKKLLDGAAKNLALTARSYLKTVRVARTIADLEASPNVLPAHVAEALQFR